MQNDKPKEHPSSQESQSPIPKQSTWRKFKRWCYINHRILAIIMMIILIIIGIWFNPFEDLNLELLVENTDQCGGGKIGSVLKRVRSTAKSSGIQLANKSTDASLIAKEGPELKLNDLKGKTGLFQKASALSSSAASGAIKKIGRAPDYIMDKFRDNASLIYEVFYQTAFIVIILLIVFPTIGF